MQAAFSVHGAVQTVVDADVMNRFTCDGHMKYTSLYDSAQLPHRAGAWNLGDTIDQVPPVYNMQSAII